LQSSLGKLQFVDFRVEKKIELESGYIALRKRPHLQSASRSVGQPVSKSRSKMVHLPHPFCRFFCCFSCKCSVSSGFMVNLCNLCGVLCKLKAPLLCFFLFSVYARIRGSKWSITLCLGHPFRLFDFCSFGSGIAITTRQQLEDSDSNCNLGPPIWRSTVEKLGKLRGWFRYGLSELPFIGFWSKWGWSC